MKKRISGITETFIFDFPHGFLQYLCPNSDVFSLSDSFRQLCSIVGNYISYRSYRRSQASFSGRLCADFFLIRYQLT